MFPPRESLKDATVEQRRHHSCARIAVILVASRARSSRTTVVLRVGGVFVLNARSSVVFHRAVEIFFFLAVGKRQKKKKHFRDGGDAEPLGAHAGGAAGPGAAGPGVSGPHRQDPVRSRPPPTEREREIKSRLIFASAAHSRSPSPSFYTSALERVDTFCVGCCCCASFPPPHLTSMGRRYSLFSPFHTTTTMYWPMASFPIATNNHPQLFSQHLLLFLDHLFSDTT